MEPNETMVDDLDIGETDEFPEDIVEEEDESEEDLEEFVEDVEDTPEEPAEEEPEPPAKEPGYVKQRIEKAVQKALAEQQSKFDQLIEQRMAPLMEKLVESEAQELVRNRKIADIETAREYVKLKQGVPSVKESPKEDVEEQPRNEKGQFAARDQADSARHEARIEMLQHQADRIKASGGPDVIAEFMSNEDIKKAVVAGDMDFYDVAKQMQTPRRRPPSPTRTPNGATSVNRSIESMSDEQFHKLDEMLDKGVRFTYRR